MLKPHVRETIIKLVILSFFVGVALAFFDIDPKTILENFGETIQKVFNVIARFIEWAVKYVFLGAVVVLPIWFIFYIIGKLSGKTSKRD